jgi:hypothetical protein
VRINNWIVSINSDSGAVAVAILNRGSFLGNPLRGASSTHSAAEGEKQGTGMSLLLIEPFLRAQEYRVAQVVQRVGDLLESRDRRG